MKSQQKGLIGSLLVIIIALILIVGGIYYYQSKKVYVANGIGTVATTTPITSTSTTIGVAGMTQYTDSTFGFSFWYPSTWHVTVSTTSNNSNIKGGVVVKNLGVGDADSEILIQEVHSTGLTITDTGGGGPFGPVTYNFNTSMHMWMRTGDGSAAGTTSPADTSVNTMGGLHMFSGTSRFDSSIIPLSADNFVVIKDIGEFGATALAKTVVALDPSVATPLDTASQNQTIQAESDAFTKEMAQ